MTSFRQRSVDPELMDDLNCNGAVVDQTLRELDTINRLLGGNDVTLEGVGRLMEGRTGKTVVADMGCGSGDMAMRIVNWSRKKGWDMQVVGFDANPHIINFAREHTKAFKGASFEVMNVLSEEFSRKKFDVMVATLFMHHFTREQLVSLLKSMKQQTRIGFVINDIHRHFLAYHSIRILTYIFSKSDMVRYDAPLSVRRAFKRKELEELLDLAGIADYTIRWKWAFRWQVVVELG